MRRAGAFESSCSKFSLKQPNQAHCLAGSHRLGHLPGVLPRRLVTWRYRARCCGVWVRSCSCSSEKRTARFFKRIFGHSICLFHLGLLISSSYLLRSASSSTIQLFLNRGRGGWHAVPGPNCFLFRPAAFRYTLLQGSGGYTRSDLTAKSALFFNTLRALDLPLFCAAIEVLLARALRVGIVQFSDRTFQLGRTPRSTLPIGVRHPARQPMRQCVPAQALNGSTTVEFFTIFRPRHAPAAAWTES